MKKKIYLLLGCVTLFSFYGCEKDLKEYEGKDGLYFDVQYTNTPWFTNQEMWAHQIYSVVKFTNLDVDETVLNLKVATVGQERDYDRPFQIVVVKDSTTAISGTEYLDLTETGIIKAGERTGYISVKVKKTDRMTKENVQLQVALLPNEYFSLPYEHLSNVPGRYSETLRLYSTNDDPRIHNVFLTDILMRPKYFSSYYFGEYSEKKYRLMLELYPDAKPEDYENNNTMPTSRMNVITEILVSYLIEMKEEGHPVLDEDGTVMYAKGTPWAPGTKPEDL